jgi:2-polyprenyl-3-methyl-5-hydroxy-6-metoxy-1,4-benzoquinol methylase
MTMRPISAKTVEEVTLEWERIARHRALQIQTGKDISYRYILLPCIIELSSGCNFDSVIDLGCGAGFTTEELAKRANRIAAVDLSHENIQISRERLGCHSNLTLVNSSVEQYTETQHPGTFTLAVANMMLMTALSLDSVIRATAQLLKRGGQFVFTITHPWFWSQYWQYADADWFNYSSEIIIEAPFVISLQKEEAFITTHIHRPLEQYVNVLHKHGFVIETIVEPMPAEEHKSLYPLPWQFPRFLGVRCVLAN